MKQIAFFFFTFFTFTYTFSQECTCQKPDFQAAYDSAAVVFLGKVTEFTTNWVSGGMKASFQVSQKWKSEGESFIVVNTPFPQNCGYTFEVGKTYLIYAQKKRVTHKSSACYRILPIENAQEDLEKLGKSNKIGTGKAQYFIIGMCLWMLGSSMFILFVVLRRRQKKSIENERIKN